MTHLEDMKVEDVEALVGRNFLILLGMELKVLVDTDLEFVVAIELEVLGSRILLFLVGKQLRVLVENYVKVYVLMGGRWKVLKSDKMENNLKILVDSPFLCQLCLENHHQD